LHHCLSRQSEIVDVGPSIIGSIHFISYWASTSLLTNVQFMTVHSQVSVRLALSFVVVVALVAWGIARLTTNQSEPIQIVKAVEVQNETVADYNAVLRVINTNSSDDWQLRMNINTFNIDSQRLALLEDTPSQTFNAFVTRTVKAERTLFFELDSFVSNPTDAKTVDILVDIGKLNQHIRKSTAFVKTTYGN
jgi:hypothetical protein